MKSVRDYIAQDMWGHILMTGPDIRGYLSGEKYPTVAEKKDYCQGIFTMYPHMMLGNFTRWLWEEGAPKPYEDFMSSSVEALSSKVQPVLEQCFDENHPLSQPERGKLLIPLLTDGIPKHVLTGFYDYMFAGNPEYKDILDFWQGMEPILSLTARNLRWAYREEEPMTMAQRQEVFLFVGTRMAYLILKRWYDWQFGEEKMEMPPGPPPQG